MVFWKKRSRQTLRERVDEFWKWFPTVADRYRECLLENRGNDVVPEVNKTIDKLLPGMCWVFGIEDKEKGLASFTMTGEGQITRQLIADYWQSQAVQVPNWTFFGSRQPSSAESLKDMEIQVSGEQQVDADTFLLRTSVDDENQTIDIAAWHPAFAELGEEHHMQILFIFLDEALGEFGTQTWLGEITIDSSVTEGETRSLPELPAFIESVEKYHEWKKISPLDAYTGYEIREQSSGRRGDTIVGSTCVPNLVGEFLENNGRLKDDPLPGLGAEFVYIAIDSSVFPDGEQVDVRVNIEETINEALKPHSGGRSLGGSFGINESYIEYLLYDGANSRSIISATLSELQLGSRSRIESFR